MMKQDIRWIQRLNHFNHAFARMQNAVALAAERDLSDLEQQGLIQSFEYTHELAWKTLKDFLEHRGTEALYGSKDVTRLAFKLGLIEDGDIWMDMIRDRNLTSHTYNEETAREIVEAILNLYCAAFTVFQRKMDGFKEKETL